jgi:hypothetical protein
MAKQDFSGIWLSKHTYPTKDDSAEETSEYYMTAYQTGHDLIFQSLPRDDGSYMLIRLSLDDNVAAGTWFESTAPNKDFHGTNYSGAGQMIISDNKRKMEGLWAGAGMDHKLNKLRVYTGGWELKYVGEKAPASAR